MIDHVGFPVADYARSKRFYEHALKPLGYKLIMEYGGDRTESSARRGFGADGKPDFWIGGRAALAVSFRSPSQRRTALASTHSITPRSLPAAGTMARPVYAAISSELL